MRKPKTWLVTGAGGGIGGALIEHVLARGDAAVAFSRGDADAALAANDRLLWLSVDITDDQAVAEAVDRAVARFGGIDVLVNNAGYALPGAIEELSDAALRAQFEVNFFAGVGLLRAVLPHFRRARSGHILQISSIAGQTGAPGMGAYTSSKHALEGLSVSLAPELAELGIKVTIVEPGSTSTNFRRTWVDQQSSSTSIPDYGRAHEFLASTAAHENGSSDATALAAAMVRIVDLEAPPLRLPLGTAAVAAIGKARQAQLDELAAFRDFSVAADTRAAAG